MDVCRQVKQFVEGIHPQLARVDPDPDCTQPQTAGCQQHILRGSGAINRSVAIIMLKVHVPANQNGGIGLFQHGRVRVEVHDFFHGIAFTDYDEMPGLFVYSRWGIHSRADYGFEGLRCNFTRGVFPDTPPVKYGLQCIHGLVLINIYKPCRVFLKNGLKLKIERNCTTSKISN